MKWTAAAQGYLVLIGDCAHQNQQEKTFIDLIITKQIDGMLLLGSRLPFDASIEEQRNLPPMVMANEFALSWNCLPFTLITSPQPSTP
ncbi:HTH-type transcriptional repressor CytR [Leclercia adecarboxylata]|uniref:HTH-type transcriptional repressor CytR n=1 Tax=Leclercia adecarboxylata TaxID=83655 RepID=A0A4U9IYS1_9ENTR|nr:HTH-type transcriptional repressor CytR [Leclercia adecarboxylata]